MTEEWRDWKKLYDIIKRELGVARDARKAVEEELRQRTEDNTRLTESLAENAEELHRLTKMATDAAELAEHYREENRRLTESLRAAEEDA